jgi:3D (Asp-Asp-Asp) domain-containing protein
MNTDGQNLTTNNSPGQIGITGGNSITLNVDDADSNASNEIQTITSTDGSVTVTPSGINYNLSVASVDPTVVTAGSDISVTGDGSVATPYVIANTRPDIFYPPSIEVNVATTGTGRTIDLHAEYLAQYGTPSVVSAGAPAAIPTYANNELYYYVTYFDPTVFANVSVNNVGVMTYDVIASPTDYNTLINVVFVAQ